MLGDRIRRSRSAGFDNVFFRSLSSRGHVGGLTDAATDLVAVLSLFEFRRVIIETVGAGQADVEIHDTADCTLVVTVPGLGDGVQASKAGLMEIADVFVVNKADMLGADSAARTVENALAAVYHGEPGVNAHNHLHRRCQVRPTSWPGGAAPATAIPATTATAPPVLRAVASGIATSRGRATSTVSSLGARMARRNGANRERAYAQVRGALGHARSYVRKAGSEEGRSSSGSTASQRDASPTEAARPCSIVRSSGWRAASLGRSTSCDPANQHR